jgi:membrane associated rhomboid family serine protease
MLIPIGDDDRELYRPSLVTKALLLINAAVFFLLQGASSENAFTYGWAAIPYELTTGIDLTGIHQILVDGTVANIPHAPGPTPIWLTALSAMFMHGGFGHLFGNLLYLWIFGDNVEHRFGHRVFLAFYLVSGLVATAAQVALAPESVIPTLGASGAISGVLGAYLVLFPRNRVHALLFVWVISIPAVVAIGLWIALQLMSGWSSLVLPGAAAGGVAYGAHIGGFLAGVVMALVLRMFIREERPGLFSAVAGRGRP